MRLLSGGVKSCRLECVTTEVDSIIAHAVPQWFVYERYGAMYT